MQLRRNRNKSRIAMFLLMLACLVPNEGGAQDPTAPAPPSNQAEETSAAASPATGAPPHVPEDLPVTVVPSAPTAKPAPAAPRAPEPVMTPAAPLAPVEALPITLPPTLNQVTALRTGTPLVNIPQSLSIFSGERIRDQGFTSLGEIVDYTPGLTNSQGEGHRDAIVFRGVRSTADFFLDGVRDDVEYYRALYNIDRVEILRGPSALYFGRGGTGGILNRVTKKPVIRDDFTKYEVAVDTFGANISQLDANQSLNDSSAFRLNAFYEYLNNHRNFFDGNRFGINPTYAIELRPDTRLDFSYEFADHEQFIDRGIPSANGRPARNLVGVVFGDSERNVADFQAHMIRATLNHDFNEEWKGRMSAFYGNFDKLYKNLFPTAYNPVTNIVTIGGYVDTTERQNLVLSGDILGEFGTFGVDHKVFLGAEFITSSSEVDRYNAVFSAGNLFNASSFRMQGGSGINSAGNPTTATFANRAVDLRVAVDTASVFFQDEIALGEKLDLVVGGRLDSFDTEVFNAINGVTLSRQDQQFSPRYGLVAKPFEDLSIYGSYSRSFLPQSGDQMRGLAANNVNLDPSTFSNLETGINWNIKEDFMLRTAVFAMEQFSPEPSGPGTLAMVDSETTGFEFELSGYVNENWFLSTGYTYLDGVQGSGLNAGLRRRELPKDSFSIWNKFQVSDRLGLGLGVVYQDDSFADLANRVTLPNYTRVDAAAYYQLSEKTRLQFNVENLLDVEYFPNSHTGNEITVGRPINAVFSIQSSF